MKKPIVKLNSLEKTCVNTQTQEDFNELMRVYEIGNWKMEDQKSPIKWDFWFLDKEKTCTAAEEVSFFLGPSYSRKDYNIISTQEFYEKQKITPEIIKEINEYFERKK